MIFIIIALNVQIILKRIDILILMTFFYLQELYVSPFIGRDLLYCLYSFKIFFIKMLYIIIQIYFYILYRLFLKSFLENDISNYIADKQKCNQFLLLILYLADWRSYFSYFNTSPGNYFGLGKKKIMFVIKKFFLLFFNSFSSLIKLLIILVGISVLFLILEFPFLKKINFKIWNDFRFTGCSKDSAENFHVPLTQVPPMLASYKTIAHVHKQEINVYTILLTKPQTLSR